MNPILTVVMSSLSLLATLCVLVTFVLARNKEATERGARQANLDNAIIKLEDTVDKLVQQISEQRDLLNTLKLWLELLLQQHNANHGQDIRRSLL